MEKIVLEDGAALYIGEYVIWYVEKPSKLSLEKFARATIGQVGSVPVSYKDKKAIFWILNIATEEGKIFFIITNIFYADLKEKVDYLSIDADGKLIQSSNPEKIKGGGCVLLTEKHCEGMEKILERIKEIEREENIPPTIFSVHSGAMNK